MASRSLSPASTASCDLDAVYDRQWVEGDDCEELFGCVCLDPVAIGSQVGVVTAVGEEPVEAPPVPPVEQRIQEHIDALDATSEQDDVEDALQLEPTGTTEEPDKEHNAGPPPEAIADVPAEPKDANIEDILGDNTTPDAQDSRTVTAPTPVATRKRGHWQLDSSSSGSSSSSDGE